MATLTIKNLPDDLHRSLTHAAKDTGRSLTAYSLYLLRQGAEEHERLKRKQERRRLLDQVIAELPEVPDMTPLIREDRAR